MPVRKIQVGQVWQKDGTSETFLVTKIYNEALTTYAVLRRTGDEMAPPVRVRVTHSNQTATLEGFTFTQESGDF